MQMTTKPTHPPGPYPDPITCPIHESALEEIKDIVLDTRSQVIALKNLDGPIVGLDKRVGAVESSVERAHLRVDNTDDEIEAIKKEQNKLVVRVAVIVATLSAAVNFGIAEFFK